jgi:hypothetical protein
MAAEVLLLLVLYRVIAAVLEMVALEVVVVEQAPVVVPELQPSEE